jgi:hypothetical protein
MLLESIFVLETASHYVVQVGLELVIFLPLLPEF